MALLPADLPTGLVTGQFYFVSEDAADADTDPDLTVVSGNVTFTCSAPLLRVPTKAASVIPLEFKAKFDANGQLVSASDPTAGIRLPATDSSLYNPTGFTWHVSFDLTKVSNGHTIRGLDSFDIQVPTGGTIDLTTAMPISTSPGVLTVQGPATTDASQLSTGTVADARLPQRLQDAALNATYVQVPTATAQSLPTWARKRVLSQLNQSPVRILCVGDSTTAGAYSDSYTTAIGSTNQGAPNSYPAQLAKRLTAAGIPAEHSFVLPGHAGNDDARWPVGTWSYAGLGAGGNGAVTSATAGQATTITPGIVADRYIVYFFGDPGTGTITAQATGGTAVTINTAKPSGGTYPSAIVSAAAASAANTITLTNAAGTVFAYGVEAYDSANPNKVRILGAGVGGSRATDWQNGSAPGAINFIKGLAPDLSIISLGVNDGAVPNSTATVTAAIDAIAAAAAVSGDVLLMSAVPHGNASVLDDYNAAYKASGRAYVDLQKRWGHAGQTLQFLTVDNTHPNAIGYGDMATAAAQVLLSA